MKQKSTLLIFFSVTFLMGTLVGFFLKDPMLKLFPVDARHEQRDEDPEARVHRERRMHNYMIRELGLEKEQHEEFFSVMQKRRRAMRNIMEESRVETNMRIRVQADSLNFQLSEILTAEQYEKWKKMQEHYVRQRGPRGGGQPGQ